VLILVISIFVPILHPTETVLADVPICPATLSGTDCQLDPLSSSAEPFTLDNPNLLHVSCYYAAADGAGRIAVRWLVQLDPNQPGGICGDSDSRSSDPSSGQAGREIYSQTNNAAASYLGSAGGVAEMQARSHQRVYSARNGAGIQPSCGWSRSSERTR
jgi:hypothetical protein